MDMLFVIKQRMDELGLEQKDVAAGAKVTESYISQLLTGKKTPPSPERTDIYRRMEKLLKLPKGRLARLADLQHKEAIQRRVLDPPAPLFKEVRKLIVRKSDPGKTGRIRAVFEKQPFGEVERLITQKLLDVVKTLAREELDNETWLRRLARASKRGYEEVRVEIHEFLETDVFHISDEDCASFLNPLIESWDIDFATFGITIVLNQRFSARGPRRFRFVEDELEPAREMEPGLEEFLRNRALSSDVTEAEVAFLRRLRFEGRRPTPLYFYREVQSLRDPLHFHRSRAASQGDPRRSPGAKRARKKAARSKGR